MDSKLIYVYILLINVIRLWKNKELLGYYIRVLLNLFFYF